jgi:hypothetical protein
MTKPDVDRQGDEVCLDVLELVRHIEAERVPPHRRVDRPLDPISHYCPPELRYPRG